MNKTIIFECRGEYAQITPPYANVERWTYPVITPSVVRGICDSIYWHPYFYWQTIKIQILNPIQYLHCKTNEIIYTDNAKRVFIEKEGVRTQRCNGIIVNPWYRFFVKPVVFNHDKLREYNNNLDKIYGIFLDRIKNNKAYKKPYFGQRQFPVEVLSQNSNKEPCNITIKPFPMLYDTHLLDQNKVGNSMFICKIKDGEINVPSWNSGEIILTEEIKNVDE
jgi:CRISPR-associated protein Cas5d